MSLDPATATSGRKSVRHGRVTATRVEYPGGYAREQAQPIGVRHAYCFDWSCVDCARRNRGRAIQALVTWDSANARFNSEPAADGVMRYFMTVPRRPFRFADRQATRLSGQQAVNQSLSKPPEAFSLSAVM